MKQARERWTCETCGAADLYLDQTTYQGGKTLCRSCAKKNNEMKYKVGYIRGQGVECRWTKNSQGGPIIVGRKEKIGAGKWYYIDDSMWKRAKVVGISQAFDEHCALGDIFSIPV